MRLCKICSSARRREIDTRLSLGENVREIAKWLKESGEEVSPSAVGRHDKNHFRPRAAAVAREVAQGTAAATLPGASGPEVEALVEKIVSSAAALEEVAVVAMQTFRKLAHRITTDGARSLTTAEAHTFGASLKAATEAIVERHEILHGGKKVMVDAQFSGGLAGLYAELERREAEAIDRRENGDGGAASRPDPTKQ